jgi:hypothetical protein
MSKQNIKKFRKNDFSYDDNEEENYDYRNSYIEKKKQKRIEKALKTKNIQDLLDEDDYEEDWNN